MSADYAGVVNIAEELHKARTLVRKALNGRAAVKAVREIEASQPPHPLHRYRIAVYFADGAVNMYQMRQWYRPLAELAEKWPVVVLARSASGARALMTESDLPTVWVRTVRELEEFIQTQDIRIVFYVNQNTRNFQMFRYGHRWHVFINHGESDKMYMTTNQFKAYDYAFVAGDAARQRLQRTLWDYDVANRTIEIGRPQADHYSGELPYPPDDRTVVLYAPTWEGDRPSAHYGSVATHGEALVAALLATGRHRVIYRPHPRSGVVDREFGAANERIIAALEAANGADSGAHHVYDQGADLGWQLAAADVAIVDISAMVYDRLAAGRPLLITRPVDPEAEIDEHGYLSDCEWLDADSAGDIVAALDQLRNDPEAVARLEHWVRQYFGDTSPGAATARFHEAVQRLMDEWDRWHELMSGVQDETDEEAELDEE